MYYKIIVIVYFYSSHINNRIVVKSRDWKIHRCVCNPLVRISDTYGVISPGVQTSILRCKFEPLELLSAGLTDVQFYFQIARKIILNLRFYFFGHCIIKLKS